jgi:hypothetical protein
MVAPCGRFSSATTAACFDLARVSETLDWGPADLDLRAEEFDFLRAESVIKHFCGGRYGPSNSQKPTKKYEAASLGGLLPFCRARGYLTSIA